MISHAGMIASYFSIWMFGHPIKIAPVTTEQIEEVNEFIES